MSEITQHEQTQQTVKPKVETQLSESVSEEISDKTQDNSEASNTHEVESKDSEDKKEAVPKGVQKKIDKLTKLRADAQRELEYWKTQALKQAQAETEKPVEKKAESIDLSSKPKADNFDSHEDYVEALTDWKLEQKEKEREAKQKETQVKTEYQKQVESFQSKVKDFQKTVEDFEDVISEVDDISLSIGIQDSLLNSELGPQIMYELAKDRKELERINSLSPISAAREIGKIEARIANESSSEKEQQKKLTKAPPPVSPLGAGSAKVMKSPEDMSFKEYAAWRTAKK